MSEIASQAARPDGPPLPEQAWLAALAGAPQWSPAPVGADAARCAWLIVAPHPDDETLGAGGLIARLARRGDPVRLVLVTAGEAAEVDVPMLADRRRREHRAALRALGAGEVPVVELHLPDGRVGEHEADLARSLQALLSDRGTLVGPLAWDGHPDHDATARACRAAAARRGCPLLEYPIWAWERLDLDTFPGDRARKLTLRPEERARKAEAVACFESQIAPPGGPAVLPPGVLSRFARAFETFVPSPGPGAAR